jgi:hypothetical protein
MMTTRECLQLFKEMGWLTFPFSGMDLDVLEHKFNEDCYILHPDGFEVE